MFDPEEDPTPVNDFNCPLFHFSPPKVKHVKLTSVFGSVTESSKNQLIYINNLRKSVIDALKKDKNTINTTSMQNAMETYLPQLFALLDTLIDQGGETQVSLSFGWITSIHKHYKGGYRTFYNDFTYESVFMLLIYGFNIYNQGSTLHQLSLDDNEFKQEHKSIIKFLNTAAGIFHHIASIELESGGRISEKKLLKAPVECNSQICEALSIMCLAESESLVVRKAIQAGMKEKIIAKITLSVNSRWVRCEELIRSSGKEKFISQHWKEYIRSNVLLWSAKTKKYLAISSYKEEKIGQAQGLIQSALASLKKISYARRDQIAKKWLAHVQTENDLLIYYLKKYRKENESFAFEKIPNEEQIIALIPPKRGMVQIVPFSPPEKVNLQIVPKKSNCVLM
ncbi:bro1 domain-containing protein brox [Anaeramoeba flamelloides]|uniref:Bro1 domain-containing protein brox n=1 Tax=Anaeramoeba flamelloides TaxID=1746091 RepID=A0AAV8A8F8_9EUKA|nr:bro1 domain-containing protein brox [Anaeramoeba flamelloides]KAJ6250869.1 bro1 domain-containing protein brox [Anaeramoeba flamelloides]